MQYKVPQNIDMADRIVGPLTLLQFLYLLTGGIIIYVLFSLVLPINTVLFFSLAVPIGLFSFALAFLKIQDQPFGKFVVSFFVFLFRPKARIWVKEGLESEVVVATPAPSQPAQVAQKGIRRGQLEQLAQTLDTSGSVQPPPAHQPTPGRPQVDGVQGR